MRVISLSQLTLHFQTYFNYLSRLFSPHEAHILNINIINKKHSFFHEWSHIESHHPPEDEDDNVGRIVTILVIYLCVFI